MDLTLTPEFKREPSGIPFRIREQQEFILYKYSGRYETGIIQHILLIRKG